MNVENQILKASFCGKFQKAVKPKRFTFFLQQQNEKKSTQSNTWFFLLEYFCLNGFWNLCKINLQEHLFSIKK